MTASPPSFYWHAGTMAVIHAVRGWREQGLPCYFTIDAGANVHVICEAAHAAEVGAALNELPEVQFTIANGPGPGTRIVEESLP